MTSPDYLDVQGAGDGSRAERGGVLAGDRITAINGIRVSDIAPQNLSQAASAIPLVLTVKRDGSEVVLTIPEE